MRNKVFIVKDTIQAGDTSASPASVSAIDLFVVDLREPAETRELAGRLFDESFRGQFAIALLHLSERTKPALDELLIILSHTCYCRQFDDILVFVAGDPGYETACTLAHDFLEWQGFGKIRLERVSPSLLDSDGFAYACTKKGYDEVATDTAEAMSGYSNYLLHGYDPESFLIFRTGAKLEVDSVIGMLCETEAAFRNDHPHLYSLISKLSDLNGSHSLVSRQKDVLQKEVRTFNELFELRSQNRELEHILEFYHREYEVLPLWYKRTGHVIKVITGKRTLKSLLHGKEAK